RPDVKGSTAGLVGRCGDHDHSNRQFAVTRQNEMLAQELAVLGVGGLLGQPSLVAEHSLGRMVEIRTGAGEDQGPVGGNRRQARKAITGLGAKSAERVGQAEVHFGWAPWGRRLPAPYPRRTRNATLLVTSGGCNPLPGSVGRP